jgi:hypothetical protein
MPRLICLPIRQISSRKLPTPRHKISHPRQPQRLKINQVPSLLLRRPTSMPFANHALTRPPAKHLLQPSRRPPQSRTKIRQQLHRKRKLKLPLKPDRRLSHSFLLEQSYRGPCFLNRNFNSRSGRTISSAPSTISNLCARKSAFPISFLSNRSTIRCPPVPVTGIGLFLIG